MAYVTEGIRGKEYELNKYTIYFLFAYSDRLPFEFGQGHTPTGD